MLKYKVEIDNETQRVIIHWYDEQGNECEPESGTYEVTIPKDTFIWYGDNLSCDGKNGNEEYKYTFVVAETAPKPLIAPLMKDGNIHFIITNSAVEGNYVKLGYTTNAELLGTLFKASSEIGNIKGFFVSNSDLNEFGYAENKCEYLVELDKDYEYEPSKAYTITLMPNSVYNQGLGEEYSDKKSYNDTAKLVFYGTPQPTITPLTCSLSGNIFSIDFKLDNYNSTMKNGFISTIINERRPYGISVNGNDNAFVKSESINGDILTLNLSCKNSANFIKTNADGTSAYELELVISEDYIVNEGDLISKVGEQGNIGNRQKISLPIIKECPTPKVKDEIRDSDSLTTTWTNAYISNLTTNQQSTPKMYAYMLNGEKVDITDHITFTMPNNKTNDLYIDFDSENNFGLNPTEVYNYVVEFPNAMLQNVGNGKVYEGTAESSAYSFAYEPVTSKPSVQCVATNVNPLYPIVDGENITLTNGKETTIIKANAITIADSENKKVLMGWEEGSQFTNVNVSNCQQYKMLIQEDKQARLYKTEDGLLYDAPLYTMNGNVYEDNHEGSIYINIDGEKIYNDGNGITTLGKSYATDDTISIKKYVLEVGLKNNTINLNKLGGIIDWNEQAFATIDDIPQIMGENGWGMGMGNNVLPDGSEYDVYSGLMMNVFFQYFWEYATALKYQASFGQDVVTAKKSAVDSIMAQEMRGKEIFSKWFNEDYLTNNPIEYIGTTPNQFSSYSDYPSNMTEDRKVEILQEYTDYCLSVMTTNNFILYKIPTTEKDTYSFLFDNKVKHLKLGSRFNSYNGNGEQYAPTITRLLKLDTTDQVDFKNFLYNQNSFYDWSANTDFDGTKDISGLLCQGSNYDFYQSQDGFYFNGSINTQSTMNDVEIATSAFCGNVVAEKYPNCFTFSNLKDGSYMFYDNRNLWQLPNSFNPTKLENANFMFYVVSTECGGDIKHYDSNGNCIKSGEKSYLYYDTATKELTDKATTSTIECKHPIDFQMKSIPSTWSNVSYIKTALSMFQNRRLIESVPSNWNFSSLENGEDMFSYCTSLKQTPTAWTSTDKLVVANGMFFYCENLTTIHEGFKCNNVVNARNMFANCINLTTLNSDFNPKSLENANGMFDTCSKLQSIPTSWSSIKNIQNTNNMFCSCASLSALPTLWTSCDAQSTQSMFYGCTSLNECNIEFTQPSTFNDMFSGCSELRKCARIDIGNFADVEARPINNCSKLVEFKIENFGKIENYTSKNVTNKPDITLNLTFMKTTNIIESGDEEKLVESFAYVLDHLWVGETIGNPNSIEIRRADTHQRSAVTQNCKILFYGLTNEICTKVQQRVTTQVGKDVMATYLDGAERKWDYILVTS